MATSMFPGGLSPAGQSLGLGGIPGMAGFGFGDATERAPSRRSRVVVLPGGSAPPSRRVCLGSPTHAQRASKSAASTCAPSTGIRALRFPPSSRRCRAGGARLTRRLRGWKCWRRNGLGGSRRQTEYRKRKYNCGFSAQTCNVVKDTKNGEETHD
jgi:hypothetical protein